MISTRVKKSNTLMDFPSLKRERETINQTVVPVQEIGFVPTFTILPYTLKLIVLATVAQSMYK